MQRGFFLTETPDGQQQIIHRTGRKQIEVDARTGFHIKARITWLSPCTYELHPHSLPDSTQALPLVPTPVIIRIGQVQGREGYTFTAAGFDGFLEMTGYARKIRRRHYRRMKREAC
jgi:hypothetical protein